MSKQIDENVVSLEFDNSKFEKNVNTSISTLDRLKEKLNFTGATKGLDEIEKASKNIDFSHMENGIDTISGKFSKAEYMIQQRMWNIELALERIGIAFVKNLTGIDNMTAGWQKYAEQTTSVQTILSAVSQKINEATGELYNVDDVYKTIEKIGWYADETSYSTEQMTNAMATFSSSGVDLKKAEQMVMGIANACALAGVDANKASHAFLGFQKAIGAGAVTQQIWTGFLRTSGITANEEFMQSCINAAEAAGRLQKVKDGLWRTTGSTKKSGVDVTLASFQESLTETLWLNTEVMEKTFTTYVGGLNDIFSAYQDGAGTTSEIIQETIKQLNDAGEAIPQWLRSFQAAQEAVTMRQAIDSAKIGVQSAWSSVYASMFGNIEQQKKTWTQLSNDLYNIFAEPVWDIQEIIDDAFVKIKWDGVSGIERLSGAMHSLLQVVLNIKDAAKEAFEKVFDPKVTAVKISKLVKSFGDFASRMEESSEETDNFKRILESILNIFKSVGNIVGQLVGGVLDSLKKILGSLNIDISDLATKVADFLKRITDWIVNNNSLYTLITSLGNDISKAIENIKGWIDTLIKSKTAADILDGMKNSISGIRQELSNFNFASVKDGFVGFFKDIKEGNFNNIGQSIGDSLGYVYEQANGKFKKAGTIISKAFKNIKIDGNSFAETCDLIAKEFRRVAEIAIGLFVGYNIIDVISSFADALGYLAKPLKTFSDLMISWSGVGDALKNYINVLASNQTANNIVKVALALGILTAGLFALAKLDSNSLWEAIGALAAIVAITLVLSSSFASIPTIQTNAKSLFSLFIGLGGSLLLIASAMKKLSKTDPVDLVGPAIIMIALLEVLLRNISKISIGDLAKPRSILYTLIGIGVAMALLASSFAKLSNVPWENIQSGILGFAACAGAIYAITKIGSKGWNNSWGTGVLMTAASMLICLYAIEKLAAIPGDAYAASLIKLIPVFSALLILANVLKSTEHTMGLGKTGSSMGVNMLAMSGSLILMAAGIKKLATLSVPELFKGAIAGLAIMFAMAMISGFTTQKFFTGAESKLKTVGGSAFTMIALCGSLFLMAAAILIFKNMDLEGLIQGGVAVVVLLAALSAAMWLMNKSGAISGASVNSVKVLSGLATAFGVIAAAVFILAEFTDPKKLLITVVGMTAVILATSLLCTTLAKMTDNIGKALLGAATLAIILGAISGCFILLGKIGPDANKLKAIAVSMTEIILSLSVGIAAFGLIAALLGKLKIGYDTIGVVGVLGLVIEALVAIPIAVASQIKLETVQYASKVLTAVGECIGGFFGGIGAGYTKAYSEDLPEIAKNLSDSIDHISSFFKVLQGIDSGSKDKLTAISDVVNTFGQPGFTRSINSLKKNKTFFTDLNNIFDGFGQAVKNFSDKIQGINTENVSSAASAGAAIAEILSLIPNQGGLMDDIIGKKDLSGFAKGLKDIGEGIFNFSYYTQGIDASKSDDAIKLAKSMAEIQESLDPSGSTVKKWWSGEQDLGDFGEGIRQFALKLVAFNAIMSGVTIDTGENGAAAKAIELGKMFAGFNETLPEEASIKGYIFGQQETLWQFGESMKGFIISLLAINNKLKGESIDVGPTSNIQKVLYIAKTFAGINNLLPDNGGIFGSGKINLSTLGINLQTFVKALLPCLEKLKDVEEKGTLPSYETVDKTLTLCRALVSFYKWIPDDIKASLFEELGNGLEYFGYSVSMFFDAISNYNGEKVDEVIASIQKLLGADVLVTSVGQTAKDVETELKTSFTTVSESLKTWISDVVNKVVDYIHTDTAEETTQAGIDTLEDLLKGLTDQKTINKIIQAGYDAADAFNNAYRSRILINSPSKVMKRNGQYTLEGLIIGIRSKFKELYNSGDEAASIINSAFDNALDVAFEEATKDNNPVITPVLDLSQVRSQAKNLDDELGGYRKGINAYVNSSPFLNTNTSGQNVIFNVDFQIDNVGKPIDQLDVNELSNKLINSFDERLGRLIN